MTAHGRERKSKARNGNKVDLQPRAAEALARYAANNWQGPSDSFRQVTERVATAAWESEPERRAKS